MLCCEITLPNLIATPAASREMVFRAPESRDYALSQRWHYMTLITVLLSVNIVVNGRRMQHAMPLLLHWVIKGIYI